MSFNLIKNSRNIKPVIKKGEPEFDAVEEKREMSPELAKISALVTGQPKPKSTNSGANANLSKVFLLFSLSFSVQ